MQPPNSNNFLDISSNTSLLSGIKPVLELLEQKPQKIDRIFLHKKLHVKKLEKILLLCRQAKIQFIFMSSHKLDQLCSTNHQGVVARLFNAGFVDMEKIFTLLPHAPLPLILMFDQIQDPGNAGTLIRTLYAFGGAGIIIPKHNCAFLGHGARKAAGGALEQLPIAKVTNLSQTLDKANNYGFHIYGSTIATDTTSQNIFKTQLIMPAILILGNEANGTRLQLRNRCHTMLHIPMLRNINSLNVAQAGSIIISHFAQEKLSIPE